MKTTPTFHAPASPAYSTAGLRAKVPWYRNSLEDSAITAITDAPLPLVVMDPPFVIPKELRPLGHKRRYLRTIQLIDDPLPSAVADFTDSNSLPSNEVPFPQTLRGDTPKGNPQSKFHRAVTFKDTIRPSSRKHSAKAGFPPQLSSFDEQSGGDQLMSKGERHREGFHRSTRSVGRLLPLSDAGYSHRREEIRDERERCRRLSVEEAQDLINSDFYFGPNARTEFFAQYQRIHSKPYLFVEDPAKSLRANNEDDPYNDTPSTESACVPALPSSGYLQRVARELAPVGSAIAHSDLPTCDKLSPRSQYLTACVTRPYLAVPFIMRKAMTKVFDFSFQSLGDEFIIEFSKCLVNDLPYVEEINVRDNRLSDEGLNALLEAVSEGSTMLHLHRLDISQNEMGSKSAQTLRSYVVSQHCSLRTLLVDNADIDDSECAAFMTAFEKNLSIKELSMTRNCIGKSENLNVVQPNFVTGGEAIAAMLHANLVLVHLDISWNYLRLESSITLARSILENHTLRELNVAYNACGDDGAMMFGEALRCNQCLEVLDLSYNSIGCKGALVLAYALRVNRTLRSLQLNGNNLTRDGGQRLMLAICENKGEQGCEVGLRACNLSSMVSQNRGGVPQGSGKTTGAQQAAPANTEVDFSRFPVCGGTSPRVFNSKEPTGRYILQLRDPYDKMIVMELIRLATFKKGCRFVRVEYRGVNSSGGPSSKMMISLVKRERKATIMPTKLMRRPSSSDGGTSDTEDHLDTIGLDALFEDIDRDQSGSIDRKELMHVLNRIGLFPRMENLSDMLDRFDFNNSGEVQAGEEFSAFFFHAVFQLIDSDDSGKIDANEIEEAFQMLGIEQYDDKEILEAIAMYDISGDGEMEEFEFVAFMRDRLLERIKLQLAASAAGSEQDIAPIDLIDGATQKPWVVPDDGQLEIDFLFEREAFATSEEAYRYCKISQQGIEQLIHNITNLAASKGDMEDLFHVAVHDSEIRFTASQAYQLLEACDNLRSVEKKIASIVMILPQMLTAKEAQILVSRTLTLRQRCRLKAEMGSAYSVILGNPTAHYSFDLSKPKDRAAVTKIAEVAQREKLFSKNKSGRGDTSQHGNWENFRNELLDGECFVLTTAFFHMLPTSGKLSFDYVSTTRPKRGTVPLSERRFQQLIKELQTSIKVSTTSETDEPDGQDHELVENTVEEGADTPTELDTSKHKGSLHQTALSRTLSERTRQTEFWDKKRASVLKKGGWQNLVATAQASFRFSSKNTTKETVALKLVQIESAICDRWLSCAQAAEIVACMPTTFHARPETARLLFSRLIDVGNFHQIVDAMPPDDQYVCAKSLGWLNIFNPMVPERAYSLDLSIWDERETIKLLVALAINEPGENWINQTFSNVRGEPGIPGWKLPVRWEKEDEKDGGGVNRSGYLEMEYYSGADRGCAPVPSFRKTLMSRVLAGTRLYCL
ncbi:hypothetical protein Poli38472_002114 [Pythium oligandrum]|uniref:EF-hand domain-containing protein n=1 Tax=Pythium oligandrum TaxID=41045 RepID=A0A8K1CIN9_PYTOL|nr:hypothetical protein Poli38472_002114 [Pythium oligandrum]|eukprot:TMW63173.1 hypothetical protein Poli38472_002114 [Pythium oligandrum]